ncbi:Uncharacterized protein APZ42_027997 [Daphnia magna]|uniref:Uncharacterized protein n=1 Tax=Daphnia magna TaxID=35525 RepID=A0A164QWX2_9CRUS|nr:Uncharacterized protein APZ42_027997 [Daphnia magna]
MNSSHSNPKIFFESKNSDKHPYRPKTKNLSFPVTHMMINTRSTQRKAQRV